jgi:hypothetical protein
MIILTARDKTNFQNTRQGLPLVTFRLLLGLFLLLSPPLLLAQVEEQVEEQLQEQVEGQALPPGELPEEEIVEVIVTLPGSEQMALAVITPELREQALLDLAVAARVVHEAQDELRAGNELDHAALAQTFLDDRAWLQALTDRFGWVQPHSSVLDPAAWLLLTKFQQHDLEGMPLLTPGLMPEDVLINQVFQRAQQSLAFANLPNLLFEVESDVFELWNAFLSVVTVEDVPEAAWKSVETAWFTDRQLPLPAEADDPPPEQVSVIESLPQAMSEVVLSAVDSRPPDSIGFLQLRYSLLQTIAAAEDDNTRDLAKDSLYFLSLVDGLHEGRYVDFVQGLLSITFTQLKLPEFGQDMFSLVDWLVTELPVISSHYAAKFASVDPHLNTVMASAYNVLVTIAAFEPVEPASEVTGEGEPVDGSVGNEPPSEPVGEAVDEPVEEPVEELVDYSAEFDSSRLALADAAAQLALLIPDMAYYFDTPVRARIVRETDSCIKMAARTDENGDSVMTRRQFDSCMESFLQLADRESRLAELSGDMNGPFINETLRRETSVAPWQRVNYAIGFIEEHFSTQCLPPANVLPNPLEWAVLANTMSWFAKHFPEFFETNENENRITRMRSIGEEIIQAMVEQSECLAASGTGINDIVSRVMTEYEIALRELNAGIRSAEVDFRTRKLKPGADIALDKDASQNTSFRPDSLVITPCDTRDVCEMSGNLSATRALIGLFPDEYLISDQTRMGRIEICYRNMEWVERRSELVRADDENVANYFGRLGFDLVGRYIENEEVSDIFGYRFTSPEEHHYLFAQASEEVLSDSCPVEWVGTRTVTPLREDRGGVVPNRLTYLAAARKLPSRLLQNNWDRGAEWRDWFVTGIGVSPLELPTTPEIMTRLNQHLQSLYQGEQMDIYQRILLPNARNSQGQDASLYNEMSEVSIAKAILGMQMTLFYPESLVNSDAIRRAIAGDAGLLEQRTLRRFKGDNVPLTSVSSIARERLFRFSEVWLNQPEALRRKGSSPASLIYALTRINTIYRQFFIARPEVLQEIDPAPVPEVQGQPEG